MLNPVKRFPTGSSGRVTSIERIKRETVAHLGRIKIDGLTNIVLTSYTSIRILWLGVFVASTCFCLTFIISSFETYFEHDVTTIIRYQNEQHTVFPTITICNINPLSSELAISRLNETGRATFASGAAYNNLVALELYMRQTQNRYLTNEEKESLGPLNNMFYKCTFQGVACNQSDFVFLFHPKKLICYRFNAGYDQKGNPVPLKQSVITGQGNSLTLELYVGLPNSISPLIADRGVFVYIHNATEYPLSTAPSPYLVTPGFGTSINVQRWFFNQYPYPYSLCLTRQDNSLIAPLSADPSTYNKVADLNCSTDGTKCGYRRRVCTQFCLQELTPQYCNCTNYWIPLNVTGYDYCLTSEQLACASNFYNNIFLVGDFVVRNCQDKCPLPCHLDLLYQTIAHYKYPSSLVYTRSIQANKGMQARFGNQTDFSDSANIVNNMVQFSIFYDTLSYIEVYEFQKYTFENLIANVGGHLHLFLGMSLLSFVEVIELLIQGLIILTAPQLINSSTDSK